MTRINRTEIYQTAEVPAYLLWACEESALVELRPEIRRLSDEQLRLLSAFQPLAVEAVQHQRQEFVEKSIEDGRAYWLLQVTGWQGGPLYVASHTPKPKKNKNGGWDNAHASYHDARYLAVSMLKYKDEGGVVFTLEDAYVAKADERIIYVWPNECDALAETGKHDWSYVPTGDDICRSCGLVV